MELKEAAKKVRPCLSLYLDTQGINPTKNFTCLNPDHDDQNPSSGIYNDRIRCFSCGASYDVFDAAHILEGLPASGMEWVEGNLKELARRFKIDLQLEEPTTEQLELLKCRRLYRDIANSLALSGENKLLQEEITFRKWDADKLRGLHIGTCSGEQLVLDLREKGYSDEFMIRAGIMGAASIFRPTNLIFTWHDQKGAPVGFTARSVDPDVDKKDRFLNLKYRGLVAKVFNKKCRLWNLHGAIESGKTTVYLFEGQSDVVSAIHNGIPNCVASGGSSFTLDHLIMLQECGFTEVVFVFDSDTPGHKKLEKLVADVLPEVRDLRCRIVSLPLDEDPDSYFRLYNKEDFLKLPSYSVFWWKLLSLDDDMEPSDKCSHAIKHIAAEPSPLEREKQVKELASFTGVPLKTIRDELSYLVDSQGFERQQERQRVLDRALYDIRKTPQEAEITLQTALGRLAETNKKYYGDAFSERSFVQFMDDQKLAEETKSGEYEGFKLGKDLAMFEKCLCGDWTKGVFMGFGGKPNHSKTSLLCKIAYAIATHNENVTVIYHSIDDSAEQILPRFVCLADAQLKLKINHVRNPAFWENKGCDIRSNRDSGYEKVRKLASDGKLLVKDATQGFSLQFAESLITYHQEKHPERRVVYFLDNFHKLQDFPGTDERVRFKHLSSHVKDMATRLQIPILASVEYTKLQAGVKPTNNAVAESAQLEYDCNFLAHVYNEMADLPSSFSVCHGDLSQMELTSKDPQAIVPLSGLGEILDGTDNQGWDTLLPRVEIIVGKNKISEWKGSFFIDFWPAASDFRSCTQAQVAKDRMKLLSIRKKQKELIGGDDPFDSKKGFGIKEN